MKIALIVLVVIVLAMSGAFLFVRSHNQAVKREQERREEQRQEEVRRSLAQWQEEQEAKFQKAQLEYEACLSDSERLRARGRLVDAAKKDLECLGKKPIPLHRSLQP